MSRLFDNNTADWLSLPDLAAVRFAQLTTWTSCIFFRVEDIATDDRAFLCKHDTGSDRQMLWRTDLRASATSIEVIRGGVNVMTAIGEDTLVVDTWYVAFLANDGTGTSGGIRGSVYTLDGVLVDADTGTLPGDVSSLTEDLTIGLRSIASGASDPMDGDLAYCAYFNTEFTPDEERNYVLDPWGMAFAKGASGCELFLPLYGDVSPEPELMHGRNFTVNGSPAKGDDPPIGPRAAPYGPFAGTGAAAPANPVFMYVVPQ